MHRLLALGFEPAGHWLKDGDRLSLELTRHAAQRNILYAFVSDGTIMYIGKTVRQLATRMSGYRTPGKTQSTNINNNARILDFLSSGAAVEILALPDNGLLHYGGFHLNLAAALEDDLIRKIDPPWNGGKPEQVQQASEEEGEPTRESVPAFEETFRFTLVPTYFLRGFFNVPVVAQSHLGADGEKLEIFLADLERPILGTINRTANLNGTPRVMVGAALRDWFLSHSREMAVILVHVLSPTSIRLHSQRASSPDEAARNPG